MSEEVKQVHREPHPFVGLQNISEFIGRTVAFVGKVDRVEDGVLYMKTATGKSPFHLLLSHSLPPDFKTYFYSILLPQGSIEVECIEKELLRKLRKNFKSLSKLEAFFLFILNNFASSSLN